MPRRRKTDFADRVSSAARSVLAAVALCALAALAAQPVAGCASADAGARRGKPRQGRQELRLKSSPGGGALRPDSAPERDLQVRVHPDGSCEYMADVYTDIRRLGRRLERESVSGRGRNRKMRPIVLAARGNVPMKRLVELREALNDMGLPSVTIRSSTISTATVEDRR